MEDVTVEKGKFVSLFYSLLTFSCDISAWKQFFAKELGYKAAYFLFLMGLNVEVGLDQMYFLDAAI